MIPMLLDFLTLFFIVAGCLLLWLNVRPRRSDVIRTKFEDYYPPSPSRDAGDDIRNVDVAVIAIENARLLNELRESLQQQTATADILKVIASSPSDVQPVFDAIAHSANRLIGGFSTAVHRIIDDISHLVAFTPTNPESDEALKAAFPRHRSEVAAVALVEDGETGQIADSEMADAQTRELGRARGWRSVTFTPLMSQGTLIGYIACTRRETGVLADHHVQLLRTFADQAVIAIENVRLFNETKEALEQQKASADILRAISSSVADTQPVFDKILDSCKHLFGSDETAVLLVDEEGVVTLGAYVGKQHEAVAATFPAPVDKSPAGHAIRERRVVHYTDAANDAQLTRAVRHVAQVAGYEAMAYAPMMWNERGIGAIGVSRLKGAFSDKELALLQTFADQAVIAIQNARLFTEVRQRTEDLTKSLQQQTATADVLKAISRSTFDLPTVLQTLVESAARLCEADKATITRQKDGAFYRTESFGLSREFMDLLRDMPVQPERGSLTGRVLLEGRPVHIPDVLADPDYTFSEAQRLGDYRTALAVPMLREGVTIGLISLARSEVRPFTEKQIELVTTFADQAAIAIENVRLFDEVQAKTRDLTEALTYQTGSSNILRVIASSPTDVGPVLKAIVESACELCDASDAVVFLKDGEDLRFSAHHGSIPINMEKWPINRNWVVGRSVVDRVPVHVHDLPSEGDDFPEGRELARHQGHRTVLSVPLLREGESIGAIGLRRTEAHPFSDKQISLLQSFADQAIIAIGNVRLFEEVQAKTRDLTESLQHQTATADVLKVISRSVFNLQAVLDALVESAAHLCDTDRAVLTRKQGDRYYRAALYGFPDEAIAEMKSVPVDLESGTIVARALRNCAVVHVADVNADPEYPGSPAQTLGGVRTVLSVPLIRETQPVGAITVSRTRVEPFTEKQIDLIKTFADQAVIAIENARLFDEVQARTRDLSESLQQQTATADVLKVISRSAFDLQTVLQTLVESAARLCDADKTIVTREKNGAFYRAEAYGFSPDFQEYVKDIPIEAERGSASGRALLEGRVVHIPDVMADPEYTLTEGQRLGGYRTVLSIPLLREGFRSAS
jgi:two-component system NtrC family sensor kinase